MSLLRKCWFPILCGVIVGISLYDTFLIVKYSEEIVYLEENPVGQWLIKIADGGIEVFVRAKLTGTLAVFFALVYLWKRHRRHAIPVTVSIAAYQMGLLAYLTFAG